MHPKFKLLLNAEMARKKRDDDWIMMLLSHNISRKQIQKPVKKSKNFDRNHTEGHKILKKQYFSKRGGYPAKVFRNRYRMSRRLFVKITKEVRSHDSYFVRKRDAKGKLGLSAIQKLTSAMRQLAYGISSDATDEHTRLSKTTANESLKRFVSAIVQLYKEKYLRRPNEEDVRELQKVNEARGFPGMIGSLDCMHWEWKNCPTGHHGMYRGKSKVPTLILEAVASKDLWIWHAFFGLPGALNDLNVLARSPLFDQIADGTNPRSNFSVNGHDYDLGYYLVDGIYPEYSTFIKTIPLPDNNKHKVCNHTCTMVKTKQVIKYSSM
jgi:hypothetical protein